MKKTVLAVLVAAISIAFSATVYAATQTTSLPVNVTVVAGCSVAVGAGGISFPDYVGDVVESTGVIDVTCTNTLNYEIWLDAGLNPGSAPEYRRMSNGNGAYLLYELQTPGGAVWGDYSPNNPAPTLPLFPGKSDVGTGSNQSHTVYGLIFGGQTVPPGVFNDIVTVTVFY